MRVANLEQALSTITPLMEREGFFTATMFGSTTGLDKFRFEALKKCVGTSCIWIDHYLNRLLALDPTDAAHRHHSSDEVIFDLVSAAKLQEAAIKLALDPEADSEVNAGKRMTAEVLINFKEACERQWREWVREQVSSRTCRVQQDYWQTDCGPKIRCSNTRLKAPYPHFARPRNPYFHRI